jgi:pimeloyl-ACP methyl ester carboxylesterase
MKPEEKVIDLGEFKVNCASAGSGEPLLLLHDSDHRDSWRVWEPLLALAETRRMVMPDLIGYGRSTRPAETPDYRAQAKVVKDLAEKLGLGKVDVVGAGWGGQVAMELALEFPEAARSLVLISSAYDKEQLRRLQGLRKAALIIYAEDDMVTQLKAGYLLRDAIGTSRLEVLPPVAHDPGHDFTISHRLGKFRTERVIELVREFLADPGSMLAQPPELENELRGMALRKEEKGDEKEGSRPLP